MGRRRGRRDKDVDPRRHRGVALATTALPHRRTGVLANTVDGERRLAALALDARNDAASGSHQRQDPKEPRPFSRTGFPDSTARRRTTMMRTLASIAASCAVAIVSIAAAGPAVVQQTILGSTLSMKTKPSTPPIITFKVTAKEGG